MARDIRGLLLCGGAATRFGADKLLAGEKPIVVEAARRLVAGAGNALAIIPLGREALRRALEPLGCEVLETDRTASGMGGSLVAGVLATVRADGWIVALGDMPCVRIETIAAIAAALREGATIALPVGVHGRRGHPVGFAASLRDELLALGGDVGARSVVARHADAVREVATDDPGIFIDIDTPEDLRRIQPGDAPR
ncbi:MAG TPA: nucleotidyltransferase family protein [Usitatibacter sp.]|nr:nucleotidyltransferase family protein [Usitatibacter sp.]